ncbi:hypothetical protein V1522DRAFT_411618 [Lipomyces starkeyi]
MSALPKYLHFLSDETDWILSKGQTKQCTSAQASMQILASSIKELLSYCKSIDQAKVFRYFWSNWYRPEFGNVGSRWEIASLSGRPARLLPTMRLENYTLHLVRPRLDVLCYIICNGLVRSRIQLHLQRPSVYKDFVHVWRNKRDGFYFTDKDKWVCNCPAFVFNSRYLCKHLVHRRHLPPDLFQEHLPLIRFNDSDLAVPVTISSGIELSDCGDDAGPSAKAKELASFQLSLSENPEVTEDNDEESLGLLRFFIGQLNAIMQRDICGLIRNPQELKKKIKRSYEEALGSSRATQCHTMRKAPKSYYYMRPNKDYGKEN